MLFRIITEDINRDEIIEILNGYLKSYTLIPALGYWQGEQENSLVIEVVADYSYASTITFVAESIKKANNQEAVLVQSIGAKSVLI